MKVAAVQFKPEFKAFQDNLDTMVRLTTLAVDQGAELVVLPELATTGYSFTSKEEVRPYAEGLDYHPSWDRLTTLSRERGVAIAWGFVELSPKGKLFNAQGLVRPGSSATYRKRNLYSSDFLWATPGDVSPKIITWKGKKIGMLVCRDIRNSNEVDSEVYEPGDADIVAFSANFGSGPSPATAWVNFAKKVKTTLVVANRYGTEYGEECFNDFGKGGIVIIRPDGSCFREGFKLSAPCIVMTDV